MSVLPRVEAEEILSRPRQALDVAALELARSVDTEVRQRGTEALREFAERWDGLLQSEPLVLEREDLHRARLQLDSTTRELLERSAARIESFARAQLESIRPLDTRIGGGRAGHRLDALRSAGCYAPGGRYPLPSSVLMTVLPARVSGVAEIVVASPRPGVLIQAAASIAGADRLLCVGGAQAISALAQGIAGLPECEIIVGPGNKYVTAAKFLASARTRIDMLAGPSELLIVASQEADPRLIAADLLAQAEHDVEAIPLLLSDSPALLDAVDASLDLQLAELPTAPTATKALANGGKILIRDLDQAIEVSNRLAPEHLQLMGSAIEGRARDFRSFGALFMGPQSGEVLGDYAAGPNHVLPTGTSARSRGGLSVLDFLALRTWMRMDSGEASREVARDARDLAELEGLHGHAVAAGLRT